MAERTHLVGEIHTVAGSATEPRYNFSFNPDARCVITELLAEWSPAVSDEDIKAFLHDKNSKIGVPPVPNYRLFYGRSTCPLANIFDLKNPRVRFTHSAFDPIPVPLPLASASQRFEIALEGSPVTLTRDFGIRFSIVTRPFNS